MTGREEAETRESVLHIQLRDVLNQGLKNGSFFVWLSVDPLLGDLNREQWTDPAGLVEEIEAWLAELDPQHLEETFPSREFRDPTAAVIVTAIAKKPGSHREAGDAIVANPWPVIFEL